MWKIPRLLYEILKLPNKIKSRINKNNLLKKKRNSTVSCIVGIACRTCCPERSKCCTGACWECGNQQRNGTSREVICRCRWGLDECRRLFGTSCCSRRGRDHGWPPRRAAQIAPRGRSSSSDWRCILNYTSVRWKY